MRRSRRWRTGQAAQRQTPKCLALWLLATVDGIGSARRLARLCQEHDAYRWMRGNVPVNYHMLSDFRVAHQEALDGLLTQIIGPQGRSGWMWLKTGCGCGRAQALRPFVVRGD